MYTNVEECVIYHTFPYPCKEVACYDYSIGLLQDYNQNNMADSGLYAVVHLVRQVQFVCRLVVAAALGHLLVDHTYRLVMADNMNRLLRIVDTMLDILLMDNMGTVVNSTYLVDVGYMVHNMWLADMLDNAFDALAEHMVRHSVGRNGMLVVLVLNQHLFNYIKQMDKLIFKKFHFKHEWISVYGQHYL